jgi:hypothetical protein
MLFNHHYLAPEVVKDPSGPHHNCDVFSLCAIAAHVLCGEHPFTGHGMQQLVSIALGRRRAWTGPAGWRPLIERGLAPDPDARLDLPDLLAHLAARGTLDRA